MYPSLELARAYVSAVEHYGARLAVRRFARERALEARRCAR